MRKSPQSSQRPTGGTQRMRDAQRLVSPTREGDPGELGKAPSIKAHDLPLLSSCRRSDDEVVGAARGSHPPDVRQQDSVGLDYLKVIGLNRDGIENRGDEALAFVPSAPFCQLNAHPQLCHGNRRNSDIVTVADRLVQCIAPTLGVHQDSRIEDQSCQRSVTGSMPSRSSRSSSAQASSGRLARSASLSDFPVPPLVGPMVATARP